MGPCARLFTLRSWRQVMRGPEAGELWPTGLLVLPHPWRLIHSPRREAESLTTALRLLRSCQQWRMCEALSWCEDFVYLTPSRLFSQLCRADVVSIYRQRNLRSSMISLSSRWRLGVLSVVCRSKPKVLPWFRASPSTGEILQRTGSGLKSHRGKTNPQGSSGDTEDSREDGGRWQAVLRARLTPHLPESAEDLDTGKSHPEQRRGRWNFGYIPAGAHQWQIY